MVEVNKNKNVVVWNLQVPELLDKAVEKAITSNFHLTKAEFIRDAVREKLERIGIKPESKEVDQNR